METGTRTYALWLPEWRRCLFTNVHVTMTTMTTKTTSPSKESPSKPPIVTNDVMVGRTNPDSERASVFVINKQTKWLQLNLTTEPLRAFLEYRPTRGMTIPCSYWLIVGITPFAKALLGIGERVSGVIYRNHMRQPILGRASPPVFLLRHFITVQPARSTRSSLHWWLFSNHQFIPISWLQTALFDMPHLTCGTKLLPTLHVPYQFGASSSPSSSPSSCSDPGPVVNISHDVLHSRFKTLLFLNSFLINSHLALAQTHLL